MAHKRKPCSAAKLSPRRWRGCNLPRPPTSPPACPPARMTVARPSSFTSPSLPSMVGVTLHALFFQDNE
ncbi:hypothetical protein E2C01_040647 [Portunus trituberculatus]|uniref:Uncharacterized protein n=1 Tax=Portunus trituberculatus TaxID=210409 RepID=A0A5B7FN13_PORTR|nr:hypothetical protein [Portunus trituberculatus]